MNDLRNWLASCTCVECPTARYSSLRYKPKRLIDVGDDEQRGSVVIMESARCGDCSYTCLSYCWGGPQNTVLSKSNLDEETRSWCVPREVIPAAFEDAFKVTRLLGYRYIWIDSLCIVQDDKQDLDHEILQMPHIYKGAALTICASTSRSCSEGFLQARTDYSERSIGLSLPDGREGRIHLDGFQWGDPPVPEPLSTRAWAYQERLLSPRLLEFGWRTSRWTCGCRKSYSGHSQLVVEKPGSSIRRQSPEAQRYDLYSFMNPPGLRHYPVKVGDLFSTWCLIVRAYSRLALTHTDDRLAAIGGIAAELQRASGVKYLAGLWHNERLASMLQWRVQSHTHELRSRPTTSRAPTWSWPGIDDKVLMHRSEITVAGFGILVVDVKGGFGKKAHGSIMLQGPVRTGRWWCGNAVLQSDASEGVKIARADNPELLVLPDCYGEIFTTANGQLVLTREELTFLAIGRTISDNHIIRGLLLSRGRIEEKDSYRRVGMFQVAEQGDFVTANWDIIALKVV